ncbi:MAG: hypothetical protein ACIPMY_00985 [Rickettsia endosymbiont of Pentastiridius leporinus]
MSEEEYKNHPDIINLPEREKIFYYLIYIGRYENYNYAINYLVKNLRNSEELIQVGAIEAIGLLVERFYNIKEDLILPILFENLKGASEKILNETNITLGGIALDVPRLTKKIYLEYFKNNLKFLSSEKLKIFIDKTLINSLENEKGKIEFILSFCQNSLNYEEALEVCLYFLKKNESKKINTAAFQGLVYLIARFEKIEFRTLLPFIRKYLKHSYIGSDPWWDARDLLSRIVIMIPKLRVKIIPLLKKHYAVYLEAPSTLEYIMIKNKPKDQIKLEKMLKLYVNNLKRQKSKYNISSFQK